MGNGHEIFEKFMGTSNPFSLINEIEKEQLNKEILSAFDNTKADKNIDIKTLPPIDVDLECTLEELYNGCIKTIKYKKKNYRI
jgi:DnaJ family protein B protein 13